MQIDEVIIMTKTVVFLAENTDILNYQQAYLLIGALLQHIVQSSILNH